MGGTAAIGAPMAAAGPSPWLCQVRDERYGTREAIGAPIAGYLHIHGDSRGRPRGYAQGVTSSVRSCLHVAGRALHSGSVRVTGTSERILSERRGRADSDGNPRCPPANRTALQVTDRGHGPRTRASAPSQHSPCRDNGPTRTGVRAPHRRSALHALRGGRGAIPVAMPSARGPGCRAAAQPHLTGVPVDSGPTSARFRSGCPEVETAKTPVSPKMRQRKRLFS